MQRPAPSTDARAEAAAIAALPPLGQPYEIVRPAGGALSPTPLVFASAHSGRLYPAEMMAASILDARAIRRSEDAFVDLLIAAAPDWGATVIAAHYARAFVDLNREAWELDAGMFEDELPDFARRRTARAAAGLGSIARVVADGQDIYSRKLNFAEARRRIEGVHEPYHAALAELIEEAREAHGRALLIDWHSMPSPAGDAGAGRGCDMVLGDRYGAACSAEVTAFVEKRLRAMGYQVERNTPYAGGYVTEFYGRPSEAAHVLQIEINRALYLDERTVEPNAGFESLARDMETLTQSLAEAWPRLI